jgi:hypothetical protein
VNSEDSVDSAGHSGDQLDSLGQQLAIWMYIFAGMDLQLFSLKL